MPVKKITFRELDERYEHCHQARDVPLEAWRPDKLDEAVQKAAELYDRADEGAEFYTVSEPRLHTKVLGGPDQYTVDFINYWRRKKPPSPAVSHGP